MKSIFDNATIRPKKGQLYQLRLNSKAIIAPIFDSKFSFTAGKR